MNSQQYFYNCSKEYIDSISENIYLEVTDTISKLPKRDFQAEINRDLFWEFGSLGWSYDSVPSKTEDIPPDDLLLQGLSKKVLSMQNNRSLCESSTTIEAKWHSDYAKKYNGKLVQVEAQFGTIESMFKDFFGFRLAYYERRLSLGIEIVMSKPNLYFAHRKNSVSGMAYFDIARRTLGAIGLDCPIWLIGITGV